MNDQTWLKEITLKNFRCFRELKVEFDRHLTVLVANNGFGKTTVLDATAIALSAFVGAFHNGKRDGIDKNDVRLQVMRGEIFQMEPQYPCVLSCVGEIYGKVVSWERRRNTPNSNNTYKEANSVIQIGEELQQLVSDSDRSEVSLPIMAYYGTGRLWNQKKITEKKTFESEFYSRTAGFLDCLDPSSSYKYFVDWFRYTSKAHNDLRDQNEQRFGERGLRMETPYASLIRSISKAVNTCLKHTGWSNLRFSSIHNAPIVEHSVFGTLEVNQLSDGLRNMIAMVADIAYRVTRLNSYMKTDAILETEGIVLIDEIDMHLHPEWQQMVLLQLREAFPKIQFIVTTHSPQVLSSISKKHIRILGKSIEGKELAAIPIAESYARTNAEVIQGIMHLSPTPSFSEQTLLKEYRDLIEQGDITDSEILGKIDQLKSELNSLLGENHSELVRLTLVFRRRKILG